ncbi:uncharacterized protein LOC106644345 [Copidosoma floridanum]|uniref:uncharacterized protein LOC106644345 n=1 Tax=Copidosoma floridanum TaxID=29053 RepID=UPI0006C9701E|nr:uncharacterized protein LOC106644345 [Copidosoma floridanum]
MSFRCAVLAWYAVSGDGLSLAYFFGVFTGSADYTVYLFNESLSTGIYSSVWKLFTIVPLSKVPNPVDAGDTLLIANGAHLAKVFDFLVTNQIYDYLEDRSLLSPLQSGFWRGYSTQSALLKVSNDIRLGIDWGLITLAVYFDFRRAFDTIGHAALLRSLGCFNFSAEAIRWAHSYISDRLVAVLVLDGELTEACSVTAKISQGSGGSVGCPSP